MVRMYIPGPRAHRPRKQNQQYIRTSSYVVSHLSYVRTSYHTYHTYVRRITPVQAGTSTFVLVFRALVYGKHKYESVFVLAVSCSRVLRDAIASAMVAAPSML